MMVYYHPDTGELADELDGSCAKLLPSVASTTCRCSSSRCRTASTPPSTNPAPPSPKRARGAETARRLSATGADVLKLEFPLDVAFNDDEDEWRRACEKVSEVCESPWVLLSAGVAADVFEKQLKVACEAGASGLLAGRAIWKEAVTMSAEERASFLATVAPERLRRLTDIAAKYARPWTDFYAPPAADENWFSAYPGIE